MTILDSVVAVLMVVWAFFAARRGWQESVRTGLASHFVGAAMAAVTLLYAAARLWGRP